MGLASPSPGWAQVLLLCRSPALLLSPASCGSLSLCRPFPFPPPSMASSLVCCLCDSILTVWNFPMQVSVCAVSMSTLISAPLLNYEAVLNDSTEPGPVGCTLSSLPPSLVLSPSLPYSRMPGSSPGSSPLCFSTLVSQDLSQLSDLADAFAHAFSTAWNVLPSLFSFHPLFSLCSLK